MENTHGASKHLVNTGYYYYLTFCKHKLRGFNILCCWMLSGF